jgi:translation initiation factor IF-2
MVLGFKVAPRVGDVLDVGSVGGASNINLKEKRSAQTGAEKKHVVANGQDEENQKAFIVIVKTDVLGSLEAIIGSLEKLKNEEISVRVVGKGLGNITVDDVNLAETTGAAIFAFNVVATPIAEEMIRDKRIAFEKYSVIYDLLNYTTDQLEKLLSTEKIISELGRFKVTNIFRTEKKLMIVGGVVISGKIIKDLRARIIRDKESIGLGKIIQVQIGKQIVKDAPEGSECGIQYEGRMKLEVGDILEAYSEEEKAKKLTLDK